MNDQWKVIFGQCCEIMEVEDLFEIVQDMCYEVIVDLIDIYMFLKFYVEQWDIEGFKVVFQENVGIDVLVVEWVVEEGVDDEDIQECLEKVVDEFMV